MFVTFWAILKNLTFYVKTVLTTHQATIGKIWLLFNQTSGHTDLYYYLFLYSYYSFSLSPSRASSTKLHRSVNY